MRASVSQFSAWSKAAVSFSYQKLDVLYKLVVWDGGLNCQDLESEWNLEMLTPGH